MAIDDDYDESYIQEDASLNGDSMSGGGSAGEVLTKIELDLAYISEKVLNFDIFFMHVATKASDYEALTMENEDISIDSVEKAFEFDILSGIFDSEVKELDCFMTSLQREIVEAHQKISSIYHFDQSSTEIEEKLQDAKESLKKSQDMLSEMRMQSAKLKRTLPYDAQGNWNGVVEEVSENGHFSSMNVKWKLQTVEQQRHILQMLEKSLARELDLEKKLSDSRRNEEELKLKLSYAERETYFMEESMEKILERLFEAENAAEVLLGISKELTGKLQILQFNLNGSIHRGFEVRSKFHESTQNSSAEGSALQNLKTSGKELDDFHMLQADGLKASFKEAEDKPIIATSEAVTLREKVDSLELQLRDSDMLLQLAKASAEASQEQQNMLHSELSEMENVLEDLRENVMKAENRAENAEAKCTLLTETNLELNQELGFLRNSGTEKENLLERKLKESDTQLEHAKASVEAIEEQQNMLYSALGDMENLIEDLKAKVLKAESRAESTESKCTLLTETNLELNEELGFLRGRLESLETSLHQADDAKIATAKDIGIKTKIITDLVMKLAMERERLQIQISALTIKNKLMAEKCLETMDNVPISTNHKENGYGNEFILFKSSEEAVTDSSSTNFQVEKSIAATAVCETSTEASVSTENVVGTISKLEPVRTIEATQLNWKHLFVAIFVAVVSVLAMYLFQLENFADN